jgi:hypothetical protein
LEIYKIYIAPLKRLYSKIKGSNAFIFNNLKSFGNSQPLPIKHSFTHGLLSTVAVSVPLVLYSLIVFSYFKSI